MSAQSFTPVWLKDGECLGAKRHFRGAAREIYTYLAVLAENHGGFVFPGLEDIARHTKNWRKGKKSYSVRQVKRVIKNFIVLGILSERRVLKVHGGTYSGWQFVGHQWWSESEGGICFFKNWSQYEAQNQEDGRSNVPPDVTAGVPDDVTEIRSTVTPDVTLPRDISATAS